MRARYREDMTLDDLPVEDGWDSILRHWIDTATAAEVAEPNAMVLATVDELGIPDARTVLCKDVGPDGVVFYTNYDSRKGVQLAAAPFAAVTFTWAVMARQVRLRGPVSRIDAATTLEYWSGRPRGSQLGAWASRQSRPIDSRADLERSLAAVTEQFADVADIPVPPTWGGYLVAPREVEFWQGRDNRLHDRLQLTLTDGEWTALRLQP